MSFNILSAPQVVRTAPEFPPVAFGGDVETAKAAFGRYKRLFVQLVQSQRFGGSNHLKDWEMASKELDVVELAAPSASDFVRQTRVALSRLRPQGMLQAA